MPLTFYYLPPSPPARSVDLVIHALGLKVEYQLVDPIKGEHKTPEYIKKHPLQRIPVIDDNGFVLWESRAIMTYLVSKYGKDDSLYPKDLQKRAIVDQRLHYSNDVFFSVLQIARGLILGGDKPTKPQPNVIASLRESQENVEKLLENSRFIAGDDLTVADYAYVTLMVDAIDVFSPPGDKFPLTKAWYERCKSSMKDFDTVNMPGANMVRELYTNKLNQAMALSADESCCIRPPK